MTVTIIQGHTLREPSVLNLYNLGCPVYELYEKTDFQVTQEQKMGAHP